MNNLSIDLQTNVAYFLEHPASRMKNETILCDNIHFVKEIATTYF